MWSEGADSSALEFFETNFGLKGKTSKQENEHAAGQGQRKIHAQNEGRFINETKGDSYTKWGTIHTRNEGKFMHEGKIHTWNEEKVSQGDESGCWLVYSDSTDGRFISASFTVWSLCLRIPQAESQNSLEHVFPPRRPWLTLLTQTLFKTYPSCR